VDEGCACCAIMERRDGVVVGRIGELGAAHGEASNVLALALSRLLLAIVQFPLHVGACVGALEVPHKDSTQVSLVMDLVLQ
jgi:hypothetical protein